MRNSLADDVTETPVAVRPRTIAWLLGCTVTITASVVLTYWSMFSTVQTQGELNAARFEQQTAEIAALRHALEVDSDRMWSVFASLNRESVPAMRVPIPAAMRDGRVEVYK